eukprot:1714940-Pyramimonas_sp.AAC.1
MLPVGFSCRKSTRCNTMGAPPKVLMRPLVRGLLHVVHVTASVARAKAKRIVSTARPPPC